MTTMSVSKPLTVTLPGTTCSPCRAGRRIDTPPSSFVRRSRPTSAPSSTGGESDATLPELKCMLETSPGPAEKTNVAECQF